MYHNDWWGYVKGMIRRYQGRKGETLHGVALAEYEAVQTAIDETKALQDGEIRMKLIRMVYWENLKQYEAAEKIPCSRETAAKWNGEFIRIAAKKRGLLD